MKCMLFSNDIIKYLYRFKCKQKNSTKQNTMQLKAKMEPNTYTQRTNLIVIYLLTI